MARGFLTLRTPEIFSPFRSTGGTQTPSRRSGGETLQGFPALRTPEIFLPFRSAGGTQTLSRRPGGETLQGFPALRTPEIFSPFRSTGGTQTLRAHKQKRAWKLASMHVFYLFSPAAQA